MVPPEGVGPSTFALKGRCFAFQLRRHGVGGGIRTLGSLVKSKELWPLSYTHMVDGLGLEPSYFRISAEGLNLLSYPSLVHRGGLEPPPRLRQRRILTIRRTVNESYSTG